MVMALKRSSLSPVSFVLNISSKPPFSFRLFIPYRGQSTSIPLTFFKRLYFMSFLSHWGSIITALLSLFKTLGLVFLLSKNTKCSWRCSQFSITWILSSAHRGNATGSRFPSARSANWIHLTLLKRAPLAYGSTHIVPPPEFHVSLVICVPDMHGIVEVLFYLHFILLLSHQTNYSNIFRLDLRSLFERYLLNRSGLFSLFSLFYVIF